MRCSYDDAPCYLLDCREPRPDCQLERIMRERCEVTLMATKLLSCFARRAARNKLEREFPSRVMPVKRNPQG